MSFLTPLYILGALAVAAPILFHLIRRSPRGEVPFSSLMFLAPSPPRLTRRSRLDHILLLLLRAAALCLLAAAFARPFLRRAAKLDFDEAGQRRVAVLLDTSASMRRGDLWTRAKAMAEQVVGGSGPADQLAVLAFDATTRPVLGFEESKTLDPSRRRAVAKARLDGLRPTWGATQLGQALIDAVAAIEDVADASEKAGRMPRRVVLISDLQQGSRLDALGEFEWPSDVELDLKTVSDTGSNAGVQWLADTAESGPAEPGSALRVRVSNDAASRREAFELRWVGEKDATVGKPIAVYVPPGESRVIRVPKPSGPSPPRTLRLTGDVHGFDNTLFLAADASDEATVLYVGADAADDPNGLLYYLERAFPDAPRHRVKVVAKAPNAALAWEPARVPSLVVVTAETSAENAGRLEQYLRDGGTLLYILGASGRSATLAALADGKAVDVAEASPGGDVMLGEITFDHPLFAPLAGAQFNDFTKIRFWKYRRIDPAALGETRVLARFENGDAALVEKTVGKGSLIVLASGWNPADSQLARSSKFVPLMTMLLEGRDLRPFGEASHKVSDRVPLPPGDAAKRRTIRKPDGSTVTLAPGSTSFAETDQPGVYTIDTAQGARMFAVNLDPVESKTAPLGVETLEQLGCRLAASQDRLAADREHARQLHNAELENRQKVWRWLILAAIGVLIVETMLAGWLSRPRTTLAEGTTS